MYHYLFTNDLRISMLDYALVEAGKCFTTNTVPSAIEDKSANNNMKTLGFYFNLTEKSNCAKLAAEGNTRAVVLNFIKKFQFPNCRTNTFFEECKSDGIKLAPMRMIVQVLFMMKLLKGNAPVYITREEIKLFIFYNDKIAKTQNIDYLQLLDDIKIYRQKGTLPEYINTKEDEHYWKQEDRQIREMVKVLTWSGCISENEEGKLFIDSENLTIANKAAIYDIINYNEFWQGDTIESYRQYMDIDADLKESHIEITANVDKTRNLNYGENSLYYGVPGSGKSHTIDNIVTGNSYERVVFYPDYTYSDFVGQIMPRLKDEDGEKKLTYEFVSGPFVKILKKAIEEPTEMHYLVIEEINRGNAPAIFGDVFQLLDRSDDGEGKYHITNFDIAREVFGDENVEVKIPSNLSILATMNTSDQNVFTLDTAFQRRWNMSYIKNDIRNAEHADYKIENSDITWGQFASVVNEELLNYTAELSGSEDKQLGAYFVKKDELSTDKFPEKALKYLWDDAFKMDHEIIFNTDIKSIGDIVCEYAKPGDPLKRIMKKEIYDRMMDTSAKDILEAIDESEIFEAKSANEENE